MARGYVLQSLMTGLALAVAGPELALPFRGPGRLGLLGRDVNDHVSWFPPA